MLSGLQFSFLIRAGFAICLELSAFLGSFVRSRSSLIAENLLLRKQLAFYQEHQVRPRRLTHLGREYGSGSTKLAAPQTLSVSHRRRRTESDRPGRPQRRIRYLGE